MILLTPYEMATVLRHRQGLTIVQAAARCGLTPRQYNALIQRAVPAQLTMHAPYTLTCGEYSAIARARAGLTLPELAAMRKCSRVTLWKQEHDLTQSACALAQSWATTGMPGVTHGTEQWQVGVPSCVTLAAP